MSDRISKIAALANSANYNAEQTAEYVDGAPHIKHKSLTRLYAKLLLEVYDRASCNTKQTKVLDLGAGEGSVTLPFLELGAKVVAVDISESQLNSLYEKCIEYKDRVELRCEDIGDTLSKSTETFDIVVVNSFLHHIPDYLDLIDNASEHLNSNGIFFSFQDPLYFPSVRLHTKLFSMIAYFWWRIKKEDRIAGILRRIRRMFGIYLDESVHDNAEYHVTRDGLDQNAICELLTQKNMRYEIVRYFSTQSTIFQKYGELLQLENTFALIAQKK